MKILINTPVLGVGNNGGVSNHYYGLRPYWTEDIKYNYIGKRSTKLHSGIFWILWDIIKFIFRILFWKPNVILLNPSLNKSAMVRDTIFFLIGKLMRRKVAIFIHGWNKDYAKQINHNWFTKIYNNASCILVLAKQFRKELIEWGITCPIKLTTTKVSDNLLEGFNICLRNGKCDTLLFLSRIEKTKGIYETIDTYSILKEKFPNLKLRIVGDGSEFLNARSYVINKNIEDITFTGCLSGDRLKKEYINADFYIFPTYYGEGLPTSLLEAMAFGLPCCTRAIGGIADFFENQKMGALFDTLDANLMAKQIETIICDKKKMHEVSEYNYKYAKEHFMASSVAKKLEELLRDIN